MSEATAGMIIQHRSRPFYIIWFNAAFRPTLQNYEGLLREPNATVGTGLGWILIAIVLGTVFTFTGAAVTNGLFAILGVMTYAEASAALGATAWQGCLSAVVSVPLVAFTLALSHSFAHSLGGRGAYGKLVFLVAAYTVPLTLIYSGIGAIPVVGPILLLILLIPYLLFTGYLLSLAVQAVYQLGWLKAIVAGVVAPNVIIAVFVCCALTLFGPAVNSTFNSILTDLQ